jgi:hypothetical protein
MRPEEVPRIMFPGIMVRCKVLVKVAKIKPYILREM